MTIRKNFLLEQKMAEDLEKLAKEEGKTQTQITHEALEEYMKNKKREKRLEALNKLIGCVPSGSLVDVDARQMRIEKALKHAN
ncbi:MAG: hypothetical protein LGB78_05065 [Sulfurovum sp.]|nr:hypothetical protein [Sulfurovum sp.]MCB4763257.1 hypothetical protein [Sulfurovum sp.]MCB4779191.1 hypothetical protein [Sulfurovum sp.]